MKKTLLVALFSCALLIPGAAFADLPKADDQEVMVGASWFRPIGTGAGAFNADASYSYFLSDTVAFGIRQAYTLAHNDDASDVWNATTSPFVNWHYINEDWCLGDAHLVPYLGLFVGAAWNDRDFTGTTGPQTGLKLYLSDTTFAAVNYRYEWFFDKIGDANNVADANHVVTMGLGYNW